MFYSIFLVLFLLGRGLANPNASPKRLNSTSDHICGDIIAEVNQDNILFYAKDAYACLISVPFHAAVATRFIKYYNTTIQFQSTLAYLKTPPEGYQQPAIDVMDRLQHIQDNIDRGFYKNQYRFEIDMQMLVYAMHDSHVVLQAGILSTFSFASPYRISTASVDGKQIPKVYLTSDLIRSRDEGGIPSPIDTINGHEIVDYLLNFAALNSVGNIEPHADWNQLMEHPALDIQGMLSIFGGGTTFYPGDDELGDELVFTFENRSIPSLHSNWLAIYNTPGPTGPLTTGGDFYNFFVLGLYPKSFNADAYYNSTETPMMEDEETTMGSWYNESDHAYPINPNVVQNDLSIAGGGVLTAYFLHDISTAVLSIPSFNQYGWHIGNFSETVQNFIIEAKQANLSRVLIDVQQNTGGFIELAVTTFQQFFPQIDPYMGSRRRSMSLADILGETATSHFQPSDENGIAYEEWIITNRINAATGKNFTSWSEYRRPVVTHGDNFSQTERYNLESEIYGQNKPVQTTQPWNPSDIVILTDGLCASACSLFVELMTFQGGVRTVTIGGSPKIGPMQAASGNRGARVYSSDSLYYDFEWASTMNDTANTTLATLNDNGMYTIYSGFNLRDQIRPNETVPLQFKYIAADCRIYYTLANIYNMTQQWRDAAHAIWDDNSHCVNGSIGYSSTNTTALIPPPAPSFVLPPKNITAANNAVTNAKVGSEEIPNGNLGERIGFKTCSSTDPCGQGLSCKRISVKCSGTTVISVDACLDYCQNRDGHNSCGENHVCDIETTQGYKAHGIVTKGSSGDRLQGILHQGTCRPMTGTREMGCVEPKLEALQGRASG